MINTQHWTQIAQSDPKILAWYQQLRQQHPDEPESVIMHMSRSIMDYGDGSGQGFDYKSAIESGIRPELNQQGQYKWLGDRGPEKIFKGDLHPTRKLTDQALSKVQQIKDGQKGVVDQTINLERTQKEVKDNLITLVQQYPEARSTIMQLVKDGVHDLPTIARLARKEVQKKNPEAVIPRTKWEKVKESFSRGHSNIMMDIAWFNFKSGLGNLTYEELVKMDKEFQEMMARDPIQAEGWIEEILIPTANIAPSMWESMKEGFKGAAMGGGVAAAYTALSPIPDELIAVPAFMARGAQANVTKFWLMQGSGSIYREQVQKGVDPRIASVAGDIGGLFYAMVESYQMKGLVPVSLKKEFADLLTQSLTKNLKKIGAKTGKEYGKQVGQEIGQEAILITSEEVSTWVDNKINDGTIPHAEGEELKDRMISTIVESAKGLIIPVGVGGAVSAGSAVVKDQGKKKAEGKVEERVALESMDPQRAQLKKVDQGPREKQPTAKLEVQAALEAEEISPGSASIANYLLEQDKDFDTRSSLDISNEIMLMTDDYIRNVLKKEPEEFYAEEGITKEESEEYFATGSTTVDFQKNATRTAIKLYQGHDADTIVEEFYHDFYEHMPEKDRKAFAKYHEESGDTRSVEEHFGQEGRDFFFSEKMHEKAGGLRAVFDNVKQTLRDLIARIRKIRGAKIPKKIQTLYTKAGTREFKPLTAAQKKKIKVQKAQFQLRQKPRSKEFKSWFKDSKIVDDMGKPKVVYHGTRFKFPAFSEETANWFSDDPSFASNFADFSPGNLLFSKGELAGNVYPVYLNIKNPLDFSKVFTDVRQKLTRKGFERGLKEIIGEDNNLSIALDDAIEYANSSSDENINIHDSFAMDYSDMFAEPGNTLNNWAKNAGYDGLIVPEDTGEKIVNTYVAFNPEQIKGQFNPKPDKADPRIMFQVKKLNKRQKPRSKEFKKWFGDSKVVDDKGKPMVVYHGTDKNFDQFKMPKDQWSPRTLGGLQAFLGGHQLFYFSNNPQHASDFTIDQNKKGEFSPEKEFEPKTRAELARDRTAIGGQVYPAYLSLQNPLIIDNEGKPWDYVTKKIEKAAKGKKHDGVIVKNTLDQFAYFSHEADVYIAFNPEQIKGQFNPKPTKDDPKIMFQVKKATEIGLSLVKPRRESTKDHILVPVDIKLADKLWEMDSPDYYFPPGKGIKQRQTKIKERFKKKLPMSAPIVGISRIPKTFKHPHAGEITMGFTDGRNRFAVLRDMGAEKINLAMTQKDADLLQEISKPKIMFQLKKKEDIFFSPSERAVEDNFPPTMKSMSVINWLKRNTNNSKEIEWLDLETLVRNKQKITKEELQQWIQANKIVVRDKMLGEPNALDEEKSLSKDEFIKMFEQPDPAYPDETPGNALDDGETLEFIEDGTYYDFKYYRDGDKEYISHRDRDTNNNTITLQRVETDDLLKYKSLSEIIERGATDKRVDDLIEMLSPGATKHSQYQIPGSRKDYRELLLILPSSPTMIGKSYTPTYEAHYSEENILAHVRFNTRTSPTGEKVLFIEELQSDWHTEGREKGYKPKPIKRKYTTKDVSTLKTKIINELNRIGKTVKPELSWSHDFSLPWASDSGIINIMNDVYRDERITRVQRDKVSDLIEEFRPISDERRRIFRQTKKHVDKVPNAPFRGTDWIELVAKRMLRYAAENNFDRIAWTTGIQQVNRWESDLRMKVDNIHWQKHTPRIKSLEEFIAEDKEFMQGLGRDISETAYKQYVAEETEALKDTEGSFIEGMVGYVILNGIKDNKSIFNEKIPLSGVTTLKDKGRDQDVSLEGLVGKKYATQIRESDQKSGIVEDDNLTIGGQGLKMVYDMAFKKALDKMGKKFGARVDQVDIEPHVSDSFLKSITLPTTDEKIIKEWLKVAGDREKDDVGGNRNKEDFWIGEFKKASAWGWMTPHDKQKWIEITDSYHKQPSLSIPPEMSESAQKAAPQFQVRKKSDLALQNIPIEKQENVLALAKHLSARSQEIQKDLGIDLINSSPEAMEFISDVIAEEIKAELKNEKNGLGWYTAKVDGAMKNMAKIYPGFKQDEPEFKILLGITSNGQAPEDNLKHAMTVYDGYKETGKFDETFSNAGEKSRAMINGFKLWNTLVDKHGKEWVREFVNTEFTVSSINQWLVKNNYKKITEELAANKIMGSVIFGPKVGSFIANMNGHSQYLTMDRWFMRTVGRIRGDLIVPKDSSKQRQRFIKALKRSKVQQKLYNVKPADFNDNDKMDQVAKKIQRVYSKQIPVKENGKFVYKINKKGEKEKKMTSFSIKTELNLSANTLINRITEQKIAPQNASDRQFNRDVMHLAVKKSNVKGLTIADAQAIIWFPEKRLYAKFGVSSQRGQKETNFEAETKQLLQRRSDDKSGAKRVDANKGSDRTSRASDGKKKAKKAKEKIVFAVRHKRLIPKQKTPKQLAGPGSTFNDINLEEETRWTSWRWFVRKIADKNVRLKEVMTEVEKMRPLSAEENVYIAQDLYIGKAKDIMEKFEVSYSDFLDRVLSSGYTHDDFGLYLHAKHAQERNEHIAKINDKFPDGGSGMTNERAQEILDQYKGDKKIEALANEFYRKVTKRALRMRLNSGLIDKATYDYLNDYYKFYVPLFVVKDVENQSTPPTGKGMSIPQGSELKRAKGSDKLRGNPLWTASFEMLSLIRRAEKNKVGLKFLDIAEEFQSEAWTVKKQRHKPVYNQHGELQFMDPQFDLSDNTYAVRREGKLFLIEIKDQPLADGMKNLGIKEGVHILGKLGAFIRAVVTTYSPPFLVMNFVRDVQTALVHVSGEYKGLTGKVLKNLPAAMRGVWKNVRAKESNYWSNKYEELKKEGGKVGWFDVTDLDEHQQKLEKLLKNVEEGKTSTWGQIVNTGRMLGDFVEHANEAVESAVRLSVYDALVNSGESKTKAASVSKGITVNFNKKGQMSTFMNSIYLFFNASVQGSFRLGWSVAKHKKTRQIVAGMTASSMLLTLKNLMLDEDRWDEESEYEKDNYYYLAQLPNGSYVKIRTAYGINIFHVLGTTLAEAVWEGQKRGVKNIDIGVYMGRMLSAIDNSFNPIGSGPVEQIIAPTAFDWIVQLGTNKNFMGTPISPEKYPGAAKPDYTNYYKKYPPTWFSRHVTRFLSLISGGEETPKFRQKRDGTWEDRIVPGKVDINPNSIDHVIGFFTGGLGKFITRSLDTGINFAMGNQTNWRNVPVIKHFYDPPDMTGAHQKRLIFKMLHNRELTRYNVYEVDQFKKYVAQAIALGVLKEKHTKLVKNNLGEKVPAIIRDFEKGQRYAWGIPEPKKKKPSLF